MLAEPGSTLHHFMSIGPQSSPINKLFRALRFELELFRVVPRYPHPDRRYEPTTTWLGGCCDLQEPTHPDEPPTLIAR
jgi:hypothetical protein